MSGRSREQRWSVRGARASASTCAMRTRAQRHVTALSPDHLPPRARCPRPLPPFVLSSRRSVRASCGPPRPLPPPPRDRKRVRCRCGSTTRRGTLGVRRMRHGRQRECIQQALVAQGVRGKHTGETSWALSSLDHQRLQRQQPMQARTPRPKHQRKEPRAAVPAAGQHLRRNQAAREGAHRAYGHLQRRRWRGHPACTS
jgi:hypothetical protein